MNRVFLLLLLCSISNSFAQKFNVKGVLSDSDGNFIESATVYLESVRDSSIITYTISDASGKFQLEGKSFESKANFLVSYTGLKSIKRTIDLSKGDVDLETLILEENNEELDEVIVVADRAPIKIKKDTLEFNVKSFKTKKNATVEDLLKKLPGVEVDGDGTIKVNGKPVNKILVNGKPFFGDDPTITTRNLTKDIIEKVQVTDTKTDAEAFSGEEGDKNNKTINLTIKEENNKGTFGRVAAGGGSDKRYEFAGIINRFDNSRRVSVLAGGNNINSPGFSFGEIQKMFGGGRSVFFNDNGSFRIDGRSFGIGEGITRSRNIGANYADSYGEKVEVSADYFYSASNSDNEEATQRENILPDSRYFTNSRQSSYNNSDSHSAGIRFNIKPDSTLLINIKPSFNFAKSSSRFSRIEESLAEDQTLTNTSNSSNRSESTNKGFENTFDITKRYGGKGAFIRFNLNNESRQVESDAFLLSEINTFGTSPEIIQRDQFNDSEETFNSVFTSLTYRVPLKAKKVFLDFQYGLRMDKRTNSESAFDFNASTSSYSDFNFDLSTDYEFKNRRQTPSVELVFNEENWSFGVETGYVFRTLENTDNLRPEFNLKRDFEAVELSVNGNYRFNKKTSSYLGYNLSNRPPQLSQLQPNQDVSDPLNVVTGNPNLEPSNQHSLYMGFNTFNFQKGSGFYSYVNLGVSNNDVVAKSTIDENFIRTTTYENVNGNYRFNISASYNKTFKIDTVQTLKFRFGGFANTSRSVNYNNDIQYKSYNRSVTPNISLRYSIKDYFEINPRYSVTLSKSKFDLDDFENQDFVSHSVSLRTTTNWPKKLEWKNDLRYLYNPNVASGFQNSSWFWNSTLTYSILKDKGTISLKGYDILGQNTNASRSSSANYIQDSQSTVLERYVMLGFSWKFNSLGKKGETREYDFDF